MRVSTLSSFQNSIGAIQQLQSAIDGTQRQISSGRRIVTPADDPISAARALELRERLSRLQQFDRNINIAQSRLQAEEATLSNVNDILQRVRELALQANNSTQTNESRQLIATEIRKSLEVLIDVANAKDANGRFLFAGNADGTTPVSQAGGAFVYNGDQSERQIQIGESRSITDGNSGDEVFFRIREGNGTFAVAAAATNAGDGVVGKTSVVDASQYDNAPYTLRFVSATDFEVVDGGGAVVSTGSYQSGDSIAFRGIQLELDGEPAVGDEFEVTPSGFQDIFTTVQQIIVAVETSVIDDASRAALSNGINAGLQSIYQGIGTVLDVQTQIGTRLSSVEQQLAANESFALNVQDTLGQLEDLDYAEALSRLSREASILEAAQRSFAFTQRLLLFNFL